MWLNDDWQGADFIAHHIDGTKFLKVQLKGRLTVDKKYHKKDIYVTFNHNGKWYLYPHDHLVTEFLGMGLMSGTSSWEEKGAYSWPGLPKAILSHMEQYSL